MSRLLSGLKVPWQLLCVVCVALVTALAALVPNAAAFDGGGGTALQPSIAITASAQQTAQSANIEKAPAWITARTS